jgi:hypothetical protein
VEQRLVLLAVQAASPQTSPSTGIDLFTSVYAFRLQFYVVFMHAHVL